MTERSDQKRLIRVILPIILCILWLTYAQWAGTWIMWVLYSACAGLLAVGKDMYVRERGMCVLAAVMGVVHAIAFRGSLLYVMDAALLGIVVAMLWPARQVWFREWALSLFLWIVFFNGYYAATTVRMGFWGAWCVVMIGVVYVLECMMREYGLRSNGWRKAGVVMVCAESFLIVSFLPFPYAVLAFVSTVCSLFLIRHGLLLQSEEQRDVELHDPHFSGAWTQIAVKEAGISVAMITIVLLVSWFGQR